MKKMAWAVNIGLAAFSTFLITFFLFSVFELMPELPQKLHLDRIHYYSLVGRYEKDPILIFRNKANFSIDSYFTGDIQGFLSKNKIAPIPYHAQFDEEGFRNYGRPQNADIVVLGDSFIQIGLTEKDTFARRLEMASGMSTANYGAEWYGPAQYLEVFKRFALKRSPKIALLCFFEGNDFRDLKQYLQWENGENYYHFNLTSKNFFQRYLIALKDTGVYLSKLIIRKWDPRKATVKVGQQTFETVFSYEVNPMSAEKITETPEARRLDKVFAEFKKICLKNNITPAVVFIPTSTHIYLPYAIKWSHYPGMISHDQQLKSLENVEQAAEAAAGLAGLSWISLTPAFKEAAAKGEILYYPTDTHWNSEGRQLAAEYVKSKLAEIMPADKTAS